MTVFHKLVSYCGFTSKDLDRRAVTFQDDTVFRKDEISLHLVESTVYRGETVLSCEIYWLQEKHWKSIREMINVFILFYKMNNTLTFNEKPSPPPPTHKTNLLTYLKCLQVLLLIFNYISVHWILLVGYVLIYCSDDARQIRVKFHARASPRIRLNLSGGFVCHIFFVIFYPFKSFNSIAF